MPLDDIEEVAQMCGCHASDFESLSLDTAYDRAVDDVEAAGGIR